MNEQLWELAEQAGLLGPSSRVGNSHQATERFAELIIRECIDTAFHRGHPDLEFLLKHFGVEE